MNEPALDPRKERAVKAAAYLLCIPGGFYAAVCVILVVHWVAPGTLREHAIFTLPGIQLVSTLLIRYLFERRYLDGERVLPHWPAAKALRILAYVLSALAFVISPTVLLFTLKYL